MIDKELHQLMRQARKLNLDIYSRIVDMCDAQNASANAAHALAKQTIMDVAASSIAEIDAQVKELSERAVN